MAAKHVKAQARDSRGNEIAIASTNSDSPLLPVEQLERLHQFRPDLVDFVVNETQEEAKTRRNENRKINFYRPYPKFCVNTHFNLTVIV
ncbi:hypothetical protein Q7Y31_08070 [Glaesserella parasuis]|nr:hypothetical protein [Glaesserella parasuis]